MYPVLELLVDSFVLRSVDRRALSLEVSMESLSMESGNWEAFLRTFP